MGRLLETITILGIVYVLMAQLRYSEKRSDKSKSGAGLFRWLTSVGAKGLKERVGNVDLREEPELKVEQTIIPPK